MYRPHRLHRFMLFRLCVYGLLIMLSANLHAANHALLIGIEDYPQPKSKEWQFQQLSAPKNDVDLMKTILSAAPFNIPTSNITTLLDKQATHTGIEKAFQELKTRVKAGDFVYIHYSGHGSQHANANADDDTETPVFDENDGTWKNFDQTWVAYGSRSGIFGDLTPDDRDIIDDQINVWLGEIGTITENIVFVSDSCHSGSVSRGPKIGVRATNMDTRLYPKATSGDDLPQVGIRIGASQDKESAYEIEQGGKSYGRFTWFWAKNLKDFKASETWSDIFQRTKAMINEENMDGSINYNQMPQIILANDKDIQIAGGTIDRKKNVLIAAVDNTNQVRLNVGLLSGVTQGSIYRLASPPTPTSTSAKPNEIEIIHVEPFASTAKILSGGFKVGDILAESRHAYPLSPVKITFEADSIVDPAVKKDLVQKISQQLDPDAFEIVTDRQSDGWLVYLFQPEKKAGEYVTTKGTTLPPSKAGAPLEAWVLTMQEELLDDTLRVNLATGDASIKELTKKMANLAALQDLKALNSTPPDIDVLAHILQEDAHCNPASQICFALKNKTTFKALKSLNLQELNAQQLPLKTRLGFSIKNNSDDNYYVYILNISARDGAFAFFPPRDSTLEQALIPSQSTSQLNKAGALYFPEPGREIVKVFISRKPIDTCVFDYAGTKTRAARGSFSSPLEKLLSRAGRTRGQVEAAPVSSEWGTLQTQFAISKS